MEEVIYIDELIKKIVGRWRSILILTVVIMIIMGVYGYYTAQGKGNDYVYRSVFVVTDSDYEDTNDTMRLVNSVLKSNLVAEKVVEQQKLNQDKDASVVCNSVQVETNSNGTVTVSMTVNKHSTKKINFAFYQAYHEVGIATLLEKFPNCEVTMIDEPYVQMDPLDSAEKQDITLREVIRYALYGFVLGMIVSIFFTAIRILWNPKEYGDRKERT